MGSCRDNAARTAHAGSFRACRKAPMTGSICTGNLSFISRVYWPRGWLLAFAAALGSACPVSHLERAMQVGRCGGIALDEGGSSLREILRPCIIMGITGLRTIAGHHVSIGQHRLSARAHGPWTDQCRMLSMCHSAGHTICWWR